MEIEVTIGALDRQPQPRHVVVVIVGPPSEVAQPDAAQEAVGQVGELGVVGCVVEGAVDGGVDDEVE